MSRRGPETVTVISRPAAPLFDAYLMVDWSSNSGLHRREPSPNAPWLAEAEWGETALDWRPERYARSRAECVAFLRERLAFHLERRRRVLVGFDFSFGYPAGYAKALGLSGVPWRAIWDELARPTSPGGWTAPDNAFATTNNRNNRFEVASHLNRRVVVHGGAEGGPLYGCPASEVTPWFRQKSPGFPYRSAGGALSEFRRAEEALRKTGLRPLSSWWVLGARVPTVGGQVLTGIPSLRALRDDPDLQPARVWPFEGGFEAELPTSGPLVVYAEIWPGLVNAVLPPLAVRDQAQVRAMVTWVAQQEVAGTLRARLGTPPGLSSEEVERCVSEEGWILGALR